MSKKSAYLLVAALMAVLVGCRQDETVFYSLNKTDLAIHPKETFQFEVWEQSMDLNRIYAGDVVWSVIRQTPLDSTETEVATIDENGLLTAVNPGQAMVKAVCGNGRTAMSAITVNAWDAPDASGLVLDRYDVYQNPTQTGTDTLTLSVSDDILAKFDIEVSSSDTTLIKPLLLPPTEEALAAGNKDYKIVLQRGADITTEKDVEITVSAGETSVTCVVHISMRLYLSFSTIDLSLTDNPDLVKEASYRIRLNETDTITAYFRLQPDDAEHLAKLQETFSITTSGSSALIVEQTEFTNGRLRIFVRAGAMEGSTDVAIEALGNKIVASCSVVDINKTVVNSVTFDMDAIREKIGQDLTTSERGFSLFEDLTVDPISATIDWPVQWSSSDEAVATVATGTDVAGTFTIWQAGEFTITATCRDKSASVTIKALLKLENIAFAANLLTELPEGDRTQWRVSLTAKSGYLTDNVPVQWSSSDEGVATVAADGTITAIAAGETVIKASVTDDYGNRMETEQTLRVLSAADIDIEDLVFNTTDYLYIDDIASSGDLRGTKIQVFSTVTYDFDLYTADGSRLALKAGAVLTFGTDFIAGSRVLFPNGEDPEITAGSITVLANGNLSFDLTARKGGKEISITGEVKKY